MYVRKLLMQYYVNNCYSDVYCMSLCSSELSDLEEILGNKTGPFLTADLLELDI